MSEKLSPCPLCGGEGRKDPQGVGRELDVGCDNCGFDLYVGHWQSLPRTKKAPRCPKCGSGAIEARQYRGGDGDVLCPSCKVLFRTDEGIDAALDAWRPE